MRTWIQRQAGTALALAAVLSMALFALSAATDEGGVAWSLRAARIVPLLPVPAACAYALTLYRLRRRGEAFALEAIGVEPYAWQKWIALAALVPATVGAFALALGLDSSGLFPAASTAKACTIDVDTFVCAQAGLRVRGDDVALLAAIPAARQVTPRELAAGLAVWSCGLLVVAWAGAALTRPLYGVLAIGLLLGETVVCQAVGAGVVTPWAALLLPTLGALAMVAQRAQTTTAREPKLRA